MKTFIAAVMAIVFAVFPLASWSQDEGTGNDNAQSQDEGTGDDNAQPNIAQLFQDLNTLADKLTKDMSGVKQAIVDAGDSRDEGAKVIDQAQSSLEAVYQSLAEDGDIWTELTRTQEIWEERRSFALEKSETNPAFEAIAEEWSVKLDEAAKLRKQILSQRAESMAQLDQIASQKEVMLAYYDLGQADRALEALEQVSSDLGRVNETMRTIVDQAGQVAGPAIAQ